MFLQLDKKSQKKLKTYVGSHDVKLSLKSKPKTYFSVTSTFAMIILFFIINVSMASFWSDLGLDVSIHKNSENLPIADGDYLTKNTFYSNVFLPTFSKLKKLSENLEEELEVNSRFDMIAYTVIILMTMFMLITIPILYCIAKRTKEKIISKINWPV